MGIFDGFDPHRAAAEQRAIDHIRQWEKARAMPSISGNEFQYAYGDAISNAYAQQVPPAEPNKVLLLLGEDE